MVTSEPSRPASSDQTSEVRHGEWSELGSRDIDYTTRGARVRERDAIESIRSSADQGSARLAALYLTRILSTGYDGCFFGLVLNLDAEVLADFARALDELLIDD